MVNQVQGDSAIDAMIVPHASLETISPSDQPLVDSATGAEVVDLEWSGDVFVTELQTTIEVTCHQKGTHLNCHSS